ncbi:MAG TPA: hypothetical protein V6D13_18375 [Halomicronema sp.]
MATQNIRIVGYLPPDYHGKLREYMQKQSLTESAALVKIIKHFFDGPLEEPAHLDNEAIKQLQEEFAELNRRMAILETAVINGSARSQTKKATITPPTPVLRPQTRNDLARRLGVTPESVVQASSQSDEYFRQWSKQKDPASKGWYRQGNLFYPISD